MRLSQILPALLAGVIAAQETNGTTSPIFFLSLIPSRCQFGGASLNGDESFEASGSLCAYGREADTVYACVAGDQWCWNIGGPCSGGSATTAGPDEVACSNIGAGDVNWCCNSQFGGCTQTTFQQNNCWSNFQNPIRNLNPLNAASSASSAKQIGLTQPTLTNIIVSTLAGGGWLAEFTATSTSSSRNTLSPTSSTMALPAPSGSMSGGTIAGIVIGVIAIISSTAAVWFVFWNRRKRHRGIYESTQRVAEPLQKVAPPIEISSFPVGRHYHTDGPIELPAGHEAHAYELRSGR